MPAPDSQDPDFLDVDLEEDRYARLRLIPWWDQERLADARFMVVGAGALGNEICKNLALLGIGRTLVVDMDTIEDTNLTRSVLFRHEDQGKPKAEVTARAMRELNPDVRVQPFVGNVIHDLGQGVFREMDVVFGGLDNREARVWVNATCWKLGKPWVDGAIEVIQGVARMFVPPDGPCYECTLSEQDYELLAMRKSCALLTRDDIIEGKVPTTPTTASIVAGLQVQEAIKWLHRDRELALLDGKGFVFNGLSNDPYIVTYRRRDDCPAHDSIDEIVETDFTSQGVTLGEMLEFVRGEVSPEAVLEFDRDICTSFVCPSCDKREPVFRALGTLKGSDAQCPVCCHAREPELKHAIYGNEPYLDRALAEFGIPPFDIVRGRDGMNAKHFLLNGDREAALGELA